MLVYTKFFQHRNIQKPIFVIEFSLWHLLRTMDIYVDWVTKCVCVSFDALCTKPFITINGHGHIISKTNNSQQQFIRATIFIKNNKNKSNMKCLLVSSGLFSLLLCLVLFFVNICFAIHSHNIIHLNHDNERNVVLTARYPQRTTRIKQRKRIPQ